MKAEIKLYGYALMKVKINKRLGTYIVTSAVQANGEYIPDWQCDAHCWHDEGDYDYDLDSVTVRYPEEYDYIDQDYKFVPNEDDEKYITSIEEVIDIKFDNIIF